MVSPREHFLVFVGRELDIDEVFPTAGRDEQKRMERRGIEVERELVHFIHELMVHLRDRRVHLYTDTVGLQIPHAFDRLFERALFAAKRILAFCCREVERNRNARDAVFGNLRSNLVSHERAVRPDDGMQALLVRIVDNLPNV